jgi:hypothetical protein
MENRAGRTAKPEEANFQIVERRPKPQQAMACRFSSSRVPFVGDREVGTADIDIIGPRLLTSSADFRDLPAGRNNILNPSGSQVDPTEDRGGQKEVKKVQCRQSSWFTAS